MNRRLSDSRDVGVGRLPELRREARFHCQHLLAFGADVVHDHLEAACPGGHGNTPAQFGPGGARYEPSAEMAPSASTVPLHTIMALPLCQLSIHAVVTTPSSGSWPTRSDPSYWPGIMQAFALLGIGPCLVTAQHALAQTPDPCPPDKFTPTAQPEPDDKPLTEVGGRLVICGETVLVATPDEPPRESSIATKTDTLLRETPRSVSVTSRRTLDDRMAINITDAHDYTPGVTTMDERGPAFARGFRLGFYDLRRDGLRTDAWSVREPVALERVQYLRGPGGVLYGDGSPGGLVNLVLKKPLPVRRAEVTARASLILR